MNILLSQLGAEQADRFASHLVRQACIRAFPPLKSMEMFLTENCNLQCDYCFVRGKSPKRMSWDVAQKAVDLLFANSGDAKDINITFFGGEPFLEFELMKRIAEYSRIRASELGKTVGFAVTTNGTIMNEEIAAFGRNNGFNIMFSIDGIRKAHDLHRVFQGSRKGSWDIVTENLRLLKATQGWLGARVTVSPDNVASLSLGIKTLFDMGINQFIIGSDDDCEWNQEEMNILALEMHRIAEFYIEAKAKGLPIRITAFEKSVEELRSKYRDLWGCDAASTKIAISPEGDIYPCCKFVDSYPGVERYKLGNVYDGITGVEARMELVNGGLAKRPKCADCDYREQCVGLCYAVCAYRNGSPFEPYESGCFQVRLHRELLSKLPKEMRVHNAQNQRNIAKIL